METVDQTSSKVLLNVDPLVRDTKFLINKDLRTLEDIRKSFKQEQNGNSVLSQVRSFLPKMASANDDLQKRLAEDPEYSVNIEDVDEDEEAQHIEMNLALVEDMGSDATTDSDSSCDDDHDDDDDSNKFSHVELNEDNIKLPKTTQTKSPNHGKSLVTCLDNAATDPSVENMECSNSDKT